jgi:ribonuclease J
MRVVDSADELVFLPLGGVGEIGMNMALYGLGAKREREWLMVDCGVSFAGPELPGIDLMTPDPAFVERERSRLHALIITHAHEDHFGALLELWPRLKVPVYMTPFAAALFEAKRAGEHNPPKIPVTIMRAGDRLQFGGFDVEVVAMSHSLPEPTALAIRTRHGTVLHTGDWKIDPTPLLGPAIDLERLGQLGDEGVLAMVCDSTNALREGRSPSEADVAVGLTEVIRNAKRRVAVTIFASNVARIRSVAVAAQETGREVVIIGRAIKRAVEVGTELGYFEGLPPFRDEDAYGYLPAESVVALVTGSQGEPRAALAKIAFDEHRNVALSAGDTVVFSSRTIPGNEKAVGAIKNALVTQGVKLITDSDALIHVSGHPRRDELRDLYALVKPQISVPVHGEPLHLVAHADLAREIGVPTVLDVRNGNVVRLGPDDARTVDKVPVGILVKDGNLLVHPDASGVADRRRLSFAGGIAVAITLDEDAEPVADPIISLFGLPKRDEKGDSFFEIVRDAIDGTLDSIPRGRRKDGAMVAEAVRRSVRSEVQRRWGKKPLVEVVVMRI